MLVLSRKVGEKIVIGNNVTIVVQRIGKGRVALAIEAPQDVTVLRAELAPFGIEGDAIEFVENDAQAEGEETLPLDRPVSLPNLRQASRSAGRNARLREEAPSRTGFPRTALPLNPTSELSTQRQPHTSPSR